MQDTNIEKAPSGAFISKIIFNDDTELSIRKNDIVVFVGSNNVGKSCSLKDIYNLASQKASGTVIKEITIKEDYDGTPALESLKQVARVIDRGSMIDISYMDEILTYPKESNPCMTLSSSGKYYDNSILAKFFMAKMDTTARLTFCNAQASIARSDVRHHPIHYVAFDEGYQERLGLYFKRAFGTNIVPDMLDGARLPLRIGNVDSYQSTGLNMLKDIYNYSALLENMPLIDDQGDGMKSFASILLYLMLKHCRTFLIDEPESFLHPPQARIMGQVIGEMLSDNQQAFMSTHSEQIIQGLIDACPDRVHVVRITRDGETNHCHKLENADMKQIWDDPLLKYSNIMSGLFHKTVVICESDSDCKMYSVIDSHIKQSRGNYSEAFFTHCGGKGRIHKVLPALKKLGVDTRVIVDLDILDNVNTFKELVSCCGADWNLIEEDFTRLTTAINQIPPIPPERNLVKRSIEGVLNSSTQEKLTKQECEQIHNVAKYTSLWSQLKKSGIQLLNNDDAKAAFNKIQEILHNSGINIVNLGELESFIPDVGKHGPAWVNEVLERYPNLEDGVYSDIKNFVQSVEI